MYPNEFWCDGIYWGTNERGSWITDLAEWLGVCGLRGSGGRWVDEGSRITDRGSFNSI